MIVLLDCPQRTYAVAAQELGFEVGQLLSPPTQRADFGLPRYAMDNGAWASWRNPQIMLRMVERQKPQLARCLWVAVPDVVGSCRRTLDLWDEWTGHFAGWPLAFVAQDGAEDCDLPWDGMDCLFIGGSTQWKASRAAMETARCAKLLGKWLHVGRVNTPGRMRHWADIADSIDGTGLSQYAWMRKELNSPLLFDEEGNAHDVPLVATDGGE